MRALLHETRTGLPVVDLGVSAWDYDVGILTPDKLGVTVPAYTPRAKSMDLAELLTPYKYSLALIDESVEGQRLVRASGPITGRPPQDDENGRTAFKVTARGPEILFDYWHIRKHPGWPLLDGAGKPTGTYDLTFTGLSLGTIVKRLVQERAKWVGNELPLVFEADRAGTREYTRHEAVDGKPLLEALDQIGERADGVEWALIPEIDDLDRITYRLVTGTDAAQSIVINDHLTWNLGGPLPDIRGLEPNDLIGEVATDAIFHAGKGDDKVLLAQATDPTLVNDGWPRLEVWDSSHSSVTEQATLQAWADGRVTGVAQRPQFEVRADRAYGLMYGDFVEIASQGHWYWPDGVQTHRVFGATQSSSDPDWVGVQLV